MCISTLTGSISGEGKRREARFVTCLAVVSGMPQHATVEEFQSGRTLRGADTHGTACRDAVMFLFRELSFSHGGGLTCSRSLYLL